MRLATRRHWLNYGSALRFAAIFGGVFGLTAGAVMLRPPLRVCAVTARPGMIGA